MSPNIEKKFWENIQKFDYLCTMIISDRLKKFIFKKLYEDLSHVEIIPYKDSIWFIDRENKYWYFEFKKSGTLWWRYHFFESFFNLFSLEFKVYQSIISEWVEEVLNRKVGTTADGCNAAATKVEEVLNCKVGTTNSCVGNYNKKVEEVLNYKVGTTGAVIEEINKEVEEVLNCKVDTTEPCAYRAVHQVEEVLNYKVGTTSPSPYPYPFSVEAVLKGNN